MRRAAGIGVLLALGACASAKNTDQGLTGLALDSVNPDTIVPGGVIVIEGDSFVDDSWGDTTLRLSGGDFDLAFPARFVDFDRLEVDADVAFAALGADERELSGDAVVEVVSAEDGRTYTSAPLAVSLSFRQQLQPALTSVRSSGLIFVNEPIEVEGADLLLGGGEGTTFAVVDGCFTPEGQGGCTDLPAVEVPVTPAGPFDRGAGSFAFAPDIAGIRPGTFTGTVALRNRHAAGGELTSSSQSVGYDLTEPVIFSVSTSSASLGQYVVIEGGGFVASSTTDDAYTELRLLGTFTPSTADPPAPVDLLLIPEFVAGPTVRYVVSEDDALGQAINLRLVTGSFSGTLTPIVGWRGTEVTGSPASMNLQLAPIKQVVYLNFLPSYVESLRHFGLRAVDQIIRDRVAEVVERDYATINLEVRLEPPTDFALYAQVDIAGPDPNGMGFFGYDNSPGKDTGNQRLYDRIGGVNASTQEDGFPGYGGVFIESFFGFSMHPEDRAEMLPGADPAFDLLFDAFRPDLGNAPVSSADLAGGIDVPADGSGCPAESGTRMQKLACAVFALGSMIGTTLSHEVGHSLGLAYPDGEGFHCTGDQPNRLMDGGGARTLYERAEIYGEGPARFCDEEYVYLRAILPTSEPEDLTARPTCY
jgi:hypothetical protein